MYKAIVFAGTTEGYALCEFLAENRVSVYACAATEYGGSLLQENEFLHVSAGRLKTEDMEELFRKENPEIVLDATHPYAAEVTKNIRTACESAGVLYQRILRPEGEKNSEAIYVESTEEAAAFLSGTEGNIFRHREMCCLQQEVRNWRNLQEFRIIKSVYLPESCPFLL